MTVYKENYGSDIDGNRGRIMFEYEIDEDDRDTIVEQLRYMLEDLQEDEDYPEEMEITLICTYSDEDIQFMVTVKDYL